MMKSAVASMNSESCDWVVAAALPSEDLLGLILHCTAISWLRFLTESHCQNTSSSSSSFSPHSDLVHPSFPAQSLTAFILQIVTSQYIRTESHAIDPCSGLFC